MKSTARPELVAQLREQVEHGGLHRDVERGGDLVADDEVGPRGERARHRDSLQLAAGQLGREAAAPRAPGRRTRSSRSSTSARASARESPRRTRAGPRDLVGDAPPRVERVGRVLEDDLDAPPRLARTRLRTSPRAARRRSTIRPADGSCRPTTQRAIVVFPEPDSPTRARHSPAATVNDTSRRGDHRLVAAAGAPRASPSTWSSGAARPGVASARRAAGSSRSGGVSRHSKQRTSWPGATALRAAAARPRTASTRCAQRGANAQPGGRSPTPTATPGMPLEPARRDVIRDRRDQAARVRMPRPGEQLGGRPALDDAAGVHHGDAVGDRRHDREVVADVDDAEAALACAAGRPPRGCAPA